MVVARKVVQISQQTRKVADGVRVIYTNNRASDIGEHLRLCLAMYIPLTSASDIGEHLCLCASDIGKHLSLYLAICIALAAISLLCLVICFCPEYMKIFSEGGNFEISKSHGALRQPFILRTMTARQHPSATAQPHDLFTAHPHPFATSRSAQSFLCK